MDTHLSLNFRKMKKIILISIICILTFSCYRKNSTYPPRNLAIPIEKLRLYKSYLFINDSLSFSGTYFKKSLIPDSDKDILYNQIKVGDSLITDNYPEKYIIRRRNGENVIFYTWPDNL